MKIRGKDESDGRMIEMKLQTKTKSAFKFSKLLWQTCFF